MDKDRETAQYLADYLADYLEEDDINNRKGENLVRIIADRVRDGFRLSQLELSSGTRNLAKARFEDILYGRK